MSVLVAAGWEVVWGTCHSALGQGVQIGEHADPSNLVQLEDVMIQHRRCVIM